MKAKKKILLIAYVVVLLAVSAIILNNIFAATTYNYYDGTNNSGNSFVANIIDKEKEVVKDVSNSEFSENKEDLYYRDFIDQNSSFYCLEDNKPIPFRGETNSRTTQKIYRLDHNTGNLRARFC